MLIVLNLFILLIILGMIAIWSTYGLFSALLHLIIVVAAGTIAFAVWEPLSFMLLGRMPAYAYGVGLLAPFTVLIIVFRALFDRLCRMNVTVPRLADQIGGGLCGLLSGVLAIGVLMIGVNFMPVAKDAFGYEPYTIEGNKVVANPEGQLWGPMRVHKTAGSFFTMLSGGSMSPIGSDIGLAERRPNVAESAERSRAVFDSNQFRTAHPDSVVVTGMYEIPATREAMVELCRRGMILNMLNPSYEVPMDLRSDDPEQPMVLQTIMTKYYELVAAAPPEAEINNIVDDLLNVELIEASAETSELQLNNPTLPENFPTFVELATENSVNELMTDLRSVMGEGRSILLVDTEWNNDIPGGYNTDNTLRVALSQVRLQVQTRNGLVYVEPIAYSLQFSQNSHARRLNEVLSTQVYSADTDDVPSRMGWAFPLNDGEEPVRFVLKSLVYELDELDNVKGEDSPINRNLDDVARAFGAPPLPVPPKDRSDIMTTGVQIAQTNVFMDVSEDLPGVFSGSGANVEVDREAEPWTLVSGQADRLPRGTGGRNSRVRAIDVSDRERLVRIKIDDQVAQDFLVPAHDRDSMYVLDDGGNLRRCIGYAHLSAANEITVDIRDEFQQRDSTMGSLPPVRTGEVLFLYFEAPLEAKIDAFQVGDEIMRVSGQLEVEEK